MTLRTVLGLQFRCFVGLRTNGDWRFLWYFGATGRSVFHDRSGRNGTATSNVMPRLVVVALVADDRIWECRESVQAVLVDALRGWR
jgi:hypothetical protein